MAALLLCRQCSSALPLWLSPGQWSPNQLPRHLQDLGVEQGPIHAMGEVPAVAVLGQRLTTVEVAVEAVAQVMLLLSLAYQGQTSA